MVKWESIQTYVVEYRQKLPLKLHRLRFTNVRNKVLTEETTTHEIAGILLEIPSLSNEACRNISVTLTEFFRNLVHFPRFPRKFAQKFRTIDVLQFSILPKQRHMGSLCFSCRFFFTLNKDIKTARLSKKCNFDLANYKKLKYKRRRAVTSLRRSYI